MSDILISIAEPFSMMDWHDCTDKIQRKHTKTYKNAKNGKKMPMNLSDKQNKWTWKCTPSIKTNNQSTKKLFELIRWSIRWLLLLLLLLLQLSLLLLLLLLFLLLLLSVVVAAAVCCCCCCCCCYFCCYFCCIDSFSVNENELFSLIND